jgi:hypothetical protein
MWNWTDLGIEVSDEPEPPKSTWRHGWRLVLVELGIFGFCVAAWWFALYFGLRLWKP